MATPFALPPGMRFVPSDEELVASYLFKKLAGTLSPAEASLIPESDLYGEEEPWKLFERFGFPQLYGNSDLYFFTKLKRKSPTSSRIERSVGASGGTWHGEDAGQKIMAEVSMFEYIEAYKKRFSYRNKGSKQQCCWIMHEFSLTGISSEFVLCRLRKNESSEGARVHWKVSKKRKLEPQDAEIDLETSEAMDGFLLNLLNFSE